MYYKAIWFFLGIKALVLLVESSLRGNINRFLFFFNKDGVRVHIESMRT